MPKVGKTTILSQLSNCLIYDIEDGSRFVTALKIKVNSLAELNSVTDEVVKAGRPYKYIAIDTVTKLEDWCDVDATLYYMSTVQGKSFTGKSVCELPNGNGYLYTRMAFRKYMDRVKKAADNIIFIGHIRDKMLAGKDVKNNTEVMTKDLDLTGKNKNIACTDADSIGYLYRDKEGKLMISFKTSDTVNCGSRCEHLKGQEFEFDWKKIYID